MSKAIILLVILFCNLADAKNPNNNIPPADAGNTRLGPVTETGGRMVPDLLGKVVHSAETRAFLEGSGFSIRIIGYEKNVKGPPGTILSQQPAPWSEVKEPLIIQVTISK